jgi:hypothetical protein
MTERRELGVFRRLSVSLEELRELFDIDLVLWEPVTFPTGRDRRRWTVEDSEMLELLHISGASIAFISLIIGHSKETVLQWASAAQLRRP